MTNILAEKAVLVSLSISKWSARKFDDKVTNEVHRRHGASDETGRYSKRLVAREAMAELNAIITDARTYHYTHTFPWLDGNAAGGVRVLPSAFYLDYAEQMRVKRQQYAVVAEKFCDHFPDFKEAARKSMNGLFNEDDYPGPEKLRKLFSFEATVMPVPDQTDFRIDVAGEQAAAIRRDLESHLTSALNRGLEENAHRIVEVVGHMAARLKEYKPAKSKADKAENPFRDSLVENVRDLAKLLPVFNIADDPKMAKIIARVQKQLCAADADALRDDDSLRAKVAQNADAILADVQDYFA